MTGPLAAVATDGGNDENDEETPLQELVAGAVVGLVFLVGFGLLALGNPWFWIAFPVGFGGLLPISLALAKLYESRESDRDRDRGDRSRDHTPSVDADESDALATLRARYARGDLDEEEFEQRLERLLETENVDDARDYVGRRTRERESERERVREL